MVLPLHPRRAIVLPRALFRRHYRKSPNISENRSPIQHPEEPVQLQSWVLYLESNLLSYSINR